MGIDSATGQASGSLRSPDASPPRRGARAALFGRVVAATVTLALVLGIGLYGGFVAGRQGGGGGGGEHAEEAHGEEGHAEGPKLTPQTLANLGVEFAPLEATDFVRANDVSAVVEARADGRRAVHAPIAGRVARTYVVTGQAVKAGDPIADVVRDPFPRPVLSLTDAVLKPLNEDFHRSMSELRTSAHALEIVREELARVRRVLGSATSAATPSKLEVDLGYEERKSLRALEGARSEAHRHGLLDDEIAAIEAGTGTPPDVPPARAILVRNRLWSPAADETLALLPAAMRELPYTLATLGELAGSHALTAEVVATLRARPALAASFLDWAGLLQAGETIAALMSLEESGALAPVVVIRAPEDAPGFDVVSLAVRSGAHVETGTVVAEVEDVRTVVLRLTPTGDDVARVEKALAAREALVAEPLVEGSGARIEALTLRRMDADPDGHHAVSAVADVANDVVAELGTDGGTRVRTWRLRPGMRYLVKVPVDRLAKRFVLPSDAVIPRGPDSVVVLKEGAAFRQVPVHVEYSDAHVAVVANDGAVFPGDTVARRGAYALSLALQAGSGGGEGGGHHHHH